MLSMLLFLIVWIQSLIGSSTDPLFTCLDDYYQPWAQFQCFYLLTSNFNSTASTKINEISKDLGKMVLCAFNRRGTVSNLCPDGWSEWINIESCTSFCKKGKVLRKRKCEQVTLTNRPCMRVYT